MQTLPRKRSIHCFPFPRRPAPNNRKILLGDALFLHQQTEPPRRGRRFCDQDKPACFAIEPVYYGDLSAVGDFKSQQTGQFAPQCGWPVRLRRMHQQQRWFLDYDVIFALRDYGESGRDSCVSFRTGG